MVMMMVLRRKNDRLKCGAKVGVLRQNPRTKNITVGYLKKMGACSGRRDAFQALFPKGMPLTRENLFKCACNYLPMSWVRLKVLHPDLKEAVAILNDKAHKRFVRRQSRLMERRYKIGEAKYEKLYNKSRERYYKDQADIIGDVLGIK